MKRGRRTQQRWNILWSNLLRDQNTLHRPKPKTKSLTKVREWADADGNVWNWLRGWRRHSSAGQELLSWPPPARCTKKGPGEVKSHSVQTMRSCLSSSSTMRSPSTSTRRSGTRGREEERWSARSLNQRRLSSKSDPTSVRYLHSFCPFSWRVWFIPDLGSEAPAAFGDASGHWGKASRHLLRQSQYWICCGGPVKVNRLEVDKIQFGANDYFPFQFRETAVARNLRLLCAQLVQLRLRRQEDGQGWEPLGNVS